MTQHEPQNVKAVYESWGFTGTRKTDILLELEESGRVWVTRAEGRYELLGLERELALQLLTARPMDHIANRPKYHLASSDRELLYLYLQASLYRQDKEEIPLDALLSRSGFANLTVCPRCSVDDFIHVEGCEFMPSDNNLLPCPFCGDTNTFFSEVRTDTGQIVPDAWHVSCVKCQIDVSCGDSTQDEMRELYNRRYNSEGLGLGYCPSLGESGNG